MKFKVGDKVKIKSLDWYNENKTIDGDVLCFENIHKFTSLMSSYCDKVVTISTIITGDGEYFIEEDEEVNWWTDDMIECLVEPAPKMVDLDKACEWLRRNYTNYMINDLSKYIEDVCWFDIFDDLLVEDFRKAMEE